MCADVVSLYFSLRVFNILHWQPSRVAPFPILIAERNTVPNFMHCAVSFAVYRHVVSRARQPACIQVQRSQSVVALTPSLPDTIGLLEPGTPRLAIQVVVQSSPHESWQHTQDSATTNKWYDKVLILGPPNMVSRKTERREAFGRWLPNNYTDQ